MKTDVNTIELVKQLKSLLAKRDVSKEELIRFWKGDLSERIAILSK